MQANMIFFHRILFSRRFIAFFLFQLSTIMNAVAADGRGIPRGNEHWAATWSTALHEPDLLVPGLANTGFVNQTLRQIVHASVGGRQVRVRLSTFGAGRLVVGAAHIALSSGGSAVVPSSDRVLTFGGKPTTEIPPGAPVVSD